MRWRALWMALAAFCLASCYPAALATTQHRLRVVDAESGAPIAGATVDLHYYPSAPQAPDPNHPRGVANAEGEIAIASTATPAIWQVQAAGYAEQRFTGRDGALPPRYAAGASGPYDGVAHLYRLPEPQLTLAVQDGYTGPLTVTLQPAPGFAFVQLDPINVAFAAVDPQASYIQQAPGVRSFSEQVPAGGAATLVVTPLLYDITGSQLQVRDGAGILPSRDIATPGDNGRGVWGTISEDDKRLRHQINLFVGTLDEYKAYLRTRS